MLSISPVTAVVFRYGFKKIRSLLQNTSIWLVNSAPGDCGLKKSKTISVLNELTEILCSTVRWSLFLPHSQANAAIRNNEVQFPVSVVYVTELYLHAFTLRRLSDLRVHVHIQHFQEKTKKNFISSMAELPALIGTNWSLMTDESGAAALLTAGSPSSLLSLTHTNTDSNTTLQAWSAIVWWAMTNSTYAACVSSKQPDQNWDLHRGVWWFQLVVLFYFSPSTSHHKQTL